MKKPMKLPNFLNQELFEQVFTHRSYLNEAGKGTVSNERLEFMGDSILSFIVSTYIYEHYPTFTEGELTNLRAALTNTNALYKVAKDMELGQYLKLSRGEESSGGRENRTILADTLEAVIGGLYMDQGLDATRTFVEGVVLPDIEEMISTGLKDPKNMLQEIIQRKHKVSPLYQTLHEEGPDHNKIYSVGVFIEEKLLAEGSGKSKQEAEKNAARKALDSVMNS
jgi:ribonuclease III